MDRTYRDALTDLGLIVDRYTKDIAALGSGTVSKRRRETLDARRAAVADALAELTRGLLNADTADVPPTVAGFAEWLNRSLTNAGADAPVHPHAGWRQERVDAGEVGHCWVCVIVGHQLAHPQRDPASVGCTTDHDEGDNDHSPAAPAPPVQPVAPPPSPAAPASGILPPVDLSQPPNGPM